MSYLIVCRRTGLAFCRLTTKYFRNNRSNIQVSLRFNKNNISGTCIRSIDCFSMEDIFKGVPDRFNGLTVDSMQEPCPETKLSAKLQDSLKKWLEESRRCIWFKVNIKDAAWVPLLATKGFNFHHARDDFVMMFKWLPNNSPNLPPASHTNLGVGGLVLNDKNQVLAISEKHYTFPHWKLPGGYVERGEYIVDAAIREVKEETGVDTEFQSIIAVRHTHQMMFDNSDIYIIVMLKPTSEQITICEREINECQWMDVEEYLNHPHVHELNRLIVEKALDYKKKGIKINAVNKTIKYASFVRDQTLITVEDL